MHIFQRLLIWSTHKVTSMLPPFTLSIPIFLKLKLTKFAQSNTWQYLSNANYSKKKNIYKSIHKLSLVSLHNSTTNAIPNPIIQALKHEKLHEAMCNKFNAFLYNDAWDLVPSNSTQSLVGCRWIFQIKRNMTTLLLVIKLASLKRILSMTRCWLPWDF